MSDKDKSSLGIKSLPGSLEDALKELKSDTEYLKLFFHSELLETYLTLKEEEISEFERPESSSSHPALPRLKLFMQYYDV